MAEACRLGDSEGPVWGKGLPKPSQAPLPPPEGCVGRCFSF